MNIKSTILTFLVCAACTAHGQTSLFIYDYSQATVTTATSSEYVVELPFTLRSGPSVSGIAGDNFTMTYRVTNDSNRLFYTNTNSGVISRVMTDAGNSSGTIELDLGDFPVVTGGWNFSRMLVGFYQEGNEVGYQTGGTANFLGNGLYSESIGASVDYGVGHTPGFDWVGVDDEGNDGWFDQVIGQFDYTALDTSANPNRSASTFALLPGSAGEPNSGLGFEFVVVPEPSALFLSSLAGAFGLFRRRR